MIRDTDAEPHIPLCVLMVEDSEEDARLLATVLKRANYHIERTRVDTKDEVETQLREHEWDVVITDHGFSTFDSVDVVRLVRRQNPDIPVIIVSGRIGEEAVVEAMRLGASDYVSKDHLGLLPSAIERARRTARERYARRDAEDALREHEAQLRDILTHSTNLFYRHTPDHVLTYASPQTREFFDCEPEEALVRWTDFVTENPVNRAGYASTQRAIETGERQPPFELELMGRKGRRIWVEVHEAPVVRDGRVVAIVGALTDITQRKRVEQDLLKSEALKTGVLDSALDAIITIDREGFVVEFNHAAERIFGYARDEAIGREMAELIVPLRLRERHRRGLAQYLTTGEGPVIGQHIELPAMRADGSEFPAEVSITPTRANGEPFFTGFIRDVTTRKQTEAALEQHKAHLEDLVEERTRQLEATNRELEAFSYSVSHDLRAPLRGIEYFSKAVWEDYRDRLGPEGQDYLERVRDEAARLTGLVNDLLELSRVARGAFRHERVDLTLLAKEVVAELRQQEPGRRVDVMIQEGLEAQGDRRLLRIALANLVGNAWKYTREEAEPRIKVGSTELDGETAFFVRDNGIGFDPALADRLFRPFQRLHSDSLFTGTGVGLATVQRVIHRHAGHVWAQSRPGEGATFYFKLGENGTR